MKGWECSSMVEHLPGTYKTLGSIPSTSVKKETREEDIHGRHVPQISP